MTAVLQRIQPETLRQDLLERGVVEFRRKLRLQNRWIVTHVKPGFDGWISNGNAVFRALRIPEERFGRVQYFRDQTWRQLAADCFDRLDLVVRPGESIELFVLGSRDTDMGFGTMVELGATCRIA